MKSTEIKPGIFWVGVIDWGVRDFHGYVTPNGTTYNNYLILDEKVTLIDTVKENFSKTMLENIRNMVDPGKIEYVIINHIEPDHAGSLDKVMELAPKAVIFITSKGKQGLDRCYDTSRWTFKIVKSGDTLNTGRKTLMFLETPMLHWPDSMMTYVREDGLLISQDAFGQHYATSGRFDDEFLTCYSVYELEDSVKDYYANILMPFGSLIKAKIAEIQKLGLKIEMIAPDHGIIWRADPGKIINMYLDMAGGRADERVVIIYDTMWKSTALMTQPLMQGIQDENMEVKVIKLRATPMSIAIKEFWKARGSLFGTPTLNNIMFPSVAEFLAHLRGLRPKNRIVGAFGSFGWGGGGVKEAYAELKRMGLQMVEPGVEVRYRPGAEDESRCYEFGKDFARKVREYHRQF
ncbi:MAG: MBL fold metallo-hydrolase [Nitrospirae bacterium CG_4_9_14_3_um_filter_53_35]|nr:MAG: MBL fold metallo-hydrolase [Nitrospirae bacterium CG2_30_53_67]PIS37263.1 MAG: MBL fold metallo-hydrolase [Nitrospirae bacterium CG08_land_8_20_14_0_20_52_24]PIV84806.1 MAG: MBL fold metallo-hydrolase [Nitrospirae bacterium CG17_big_fil_post_rev_8_21_14_2_50_50_9]PIW84515.1 MAG: MBL fold metallo-hydrolase [Nitrospirae bacterium CG_4_8_14_3_um_filter_50_41]PIX84588.1 MAG: MBL fold metallo-hydrolase [Nitrospirae bacterium CG_4_10_14_3_um_filter_53_41]PJA77271.1 MAG: MBL fold metallo-hydr